MALARIVTLLPRLMADSSILVLIPHPNKQLGQWEMGTWQKAGFLSGVWSIRGKTPYFRLLLNRPTLPSRLWHTLVMVPCTLGLEHLRLLCVVICLMSWLWPCWNRFDSVCCCSQPHTEPLLQRKGQQSLYIRESLRLLGWMGWMLDYFGYVLTLHWYHFREIAGIH